MHRPGADASPRRRGARKTAHRRTITSIVLLPSDGNAWFTVDQPSTQFASFGTPEITTAGRELDVKLAKLLDALEVEIPVPLLSSFDTAPLK